MKTFWSKVQKSKGCWLWTASLTWKGYGQFTINYKNLRAHRISYELKYGKTKQQVLHKCGNRACVRPSHLYVGNNIQNVLDAVKAGTRNLSNLAPKDVIKIRRLMKSGMSGPDISRLYGTSRETIRRIKHNLTWKFV